MEEIKRALELLADRDSEVWKAERELLSRVIYEHIDDGVVQCTAKDLARAIIVFQRATACGDSTDEPNLWMYAYDVANSAIGLFKVELRNALNYFDRERDRYTNLKYARFAGGIWR